MELESGALGVPTKGTRLPYMCKKTKWCSFFLDGVCTRGQTCNFAHSAGELRNVPNLHCTKLCPTFARGIPCEAFHCTFAHSRDELRRFAPETAGARRKLQAEDYDGGGVQAASAPMPAPAMAPVPPHPGPGPGPPLGRLGVRQQLPGPSLLEAPAVDLDPNLLDWTAGGGLAREDQRCGVGLPSRRGGHRAGLWDDLAAARDAGHRRPRPYEPQAADYPVDGGGRGEYSYNYCVFEAQQDDSRSTNSGDDCNRGGGLDDFRRSVPKVIPSFAFSRGPPVHPYDSEPASISFPSQWRPRATDTDQGYRGAPPPTADPRSVGVHAPGAVGARGASPPPSAGFGGVMPARGAAAGGDPAEDWGQLGGATRRHRKTKLCCFWLAGFCKKGSQCNFAHDEGEVQPPLAGPSATGAPPRPLQGPPGVQQPPPASRQAHEAPMLLRDSIFQAASLAPDSGSAYAPDPRLDWGDRGAACRTERQRGHGRAPQAANLCPARMQPQEVHLPDPCLAADAVHAREQAHARRYPPDPRPADAAAHARRPPAGCPPGTRAADAAWHHPASYPPPDLHPAGAGSYAQQAPSSFPVDLRSADVATSARRPPTSHPPDWADAVIAHAREPPVREPPILRPADAAMRQHPASRFGEAPAADDAVRAGQPMVGYPHDPRPADVARHARQPPASYPPNLLRSPAADAAAHAHQSPASRPPDMRQTEDPDAWRPRPLRPSRAPPPSPPQSTLVPGTQGGGSLPSAHHPGDPGDPPGLSTPLEEAKGMTAEFDGGCEAPVRWKSEAASIAEEHEMTLEEMMFEPGFRAAEAISTSSAAKADGPACSSAPLASVRRRRAAKGKLDQSRFISSPAVPSAQERDPPSLWTSEASVTVKNTFLDIEVPDEEEEADGSPRKKRSSSLPARCRKGDGP